MELLLLRSALNMIVRCVCGGWVSIFVNSNGDSFRACSTFWPHQRWHRTRLDGSRVCVASLDNSHSHVFHRARAFSRFVCPTSAAVLSTRIDDHSYTLRCWEQTMHQAKRVSPFKSFVEELPRSLVQTYHLLAIVAAGCIWRAAKNITTLHVTSRHWRVERVFHVVTDLAMLLTGP